MQLIEKQALIRSLIITGSISLGVGIGIGIPFGFSYGAGSFILATVGQILLGFYNSGKQEKEAKESAKEVADRISATILNNASAFRIPIQLSCAYCSVVNTVPTSLIENNEFQCTTCNQINSVLLQFTTARITQPIAPLSHIGPDIETVRQTTINQPITVN